MNFVFSSVTSMDRLDLILELSEIEAINGILLLAKAVSLSIHYKCILYDGCKTIL